MYTSVCVPGKCACLCTGDQIFWVSVSWGCLWPCVGWSVFGRSMCMPVCGDRVCVAWCLCFPVHVNVCVQASRNLPGYLCYSMGILRVCVFSGVPGRATFTGVRMYGRVPETFRGSVECKCHWWHKGVCCVCICRLWVIVCVCVRTRGRERERAVPSAWVCVYVRACGPLHSRVSSPGMCVCVCRVRVHDLMSVCCMSLCVCRHV